MHEQKRQKEELRHCSIERKKKQNYTDSLIFFCKYRIIKQYQSFSPLLFYCGKYIIKLHNYSKLSVLLSDEQLSFLFIKDSGISKESDVEHVFASVGL